VKQSEFAQFYRVSRDSCLRAVLATVGDRPLAEDLVAEAFTRAWASWSTVGRHPAPAAWVVRTAMNTRISWWRRRRREIVLDADVDVEASTQMDGQFAENAALLGELRRLPQRQREVIVLRVFLDLDTKTTAQVLGIAPGTVTAHLSRAVTTLRQQLIPADTPEVRS